MAQSGLPALDRSLQKTHEWLKELMGELGYEDRRWAWSGLRAVLHALRNRLTTDEAVQLGAQLPLVIRGLYFEGWDSSQNPTRDRSLKDFLQHIGEDLYRMPEIEPEPLTRAVFRLLASRITAGELSDVTHILPPPIRNLWPEITPEDKAVSEESAVQPRRRTGRRSRGARKAYRSAVVRSRLR
jgi:uncharacterized protein (DUF2267 family)